MCFHLGFLSVSLFRCSVYDCLWFFPKWRRRPTAVTASRPLILIAHVPCRFPSELTPTGAFEATVSGNDFGAADYTPSGRSGGSTCEASAWLSHSEVVCTVPAGIGTGHLQVITVGIFVGSALDGAFDYDPPDLTGLSPQNGPTTADAVTSVSGANFGPYESTLVGTVGFTVCLHIVWQSDTEVTCTVAKGVNYALDVSVEVGAQIGTLQSAYYYDEPVVSAIGISNGPATGGNTVAVSGSNFGAYDSTVFVTFGDTLCSSVTWSSDSEVECTVPAGVAVSHDVSVEVGDQVGTLELAYDYDAPEVTSIDVSNGPTTGGNTVSVSGSNFGAYDSTVSVRFADTLCSSVTWSSDSEVECTVPPGVGPFHTNVHFVYVEVGTQQGTLSPWHAYNYDLPEVTSIDPIFGPPTGGNTVALSGSSFGTYDSTVSVTLGDTECSSVTWSSDSEVECTVPSGDGGPHDVSIWVAYWHRGTMLSAYEYIEP